MSGQPQGGGAPNQEVNTQGILQNALIAAQTNLTEKEAENKEAQTKLIGTQNATEEYNAAIKQIELAIKANTWEDTIEQLKQEAEESEINTKLKKVDYEIKDETKKAEIKAKRLQIADIMTDILNKKQMTAESIQRVKNLILEYNINSQEKLQNFKGSLQNTLEWIGINEQDAENISSTFTGLINKAFEIIGTK